MEVSVVPKTSASTDSPWLGLAKYAWSGWVLQLRSVLSVVSVLPGAGLAREVTCAPPVQVRDRVSQLRGGVPQPAVLVWQPGPCEHRGEDRNRACLARGKSGCWIVFVYVCSRAHAHLILLDVDGENRFPFIKLVPAVWKSLCKGSQTCFGYLEMAKLPTYSCLSKQGWWIFFSCLPSSLTGVNGLQSHLRLEKEISLFLFSNEYFFHSRLMDFWKTTTMQPNVCWMAWISWLSQYLNLAWDPQKLWPPGWQTRLPQHTGDPTLRFW